MSDWGYNAFRNLLVERLDAQDRSIDYRPMRYSEPAGAWVQAVTGAGSPPPAFLQGRRLVVDADDRRLRLYPLGRRGRFELQAGFRVAGGTTADVREVRYAVGAVVLCGDGWRVAVQVSPTLPIVELRLLDAADDGAWVRWPGEPEPEPAATGFRTPDSFELDPLIERNNSTAPDPRPLPDSPAAGVAVRALPGRVVIACDATDAATADALGRWELIRDDELRYWDVIGERLSLQVPDAPITRQLRYAPHNSLFSRSVDEDGKDIFVHGRRDRGYADTAHLHQSYQMHLPALAAGERASVLDEIESFCALQYADGWIEMSPRPLRGESRYVGRYTAVHLLLAIERYVAWTGDLDALDRRLTGRHDLVERSLEERIDLAADDLLHHRRRGLLVPCGWSDSWHPDELAQGQISAAAVLGLRSWARVARRRGREPRATELESAADEIRDALRGVMLDPETGIVAEHLFETSLQGSTADDFSSQTQIWSALAGVVNDARALDIVGDRCFRHGVSVASPTAFEEDWVRQSTDGTDDLPVESSATWRLASWPELTHLYALARLRLGDPDAALEAVRSQLPESLHLLEPRCAPFYYAEKYLYPGTRPWLCTWAGDPTLVEVVLQGFLGVEPRADRLVVAPRLPSAWRGSEITARFVWLGVQHRLVLSPNAEPGIVEVDGMPAAFVPIPARGHAQERTIVVSSR